MACTHDIDTLDIYSYVYIYIAIYLFTNTRSFSKRRRRHIQRVHSVKQYTHHKGMGDDSIIYQLSKNDG